MIVEWVHQTMGAFGYLGIALLMFAESVFPPIPSELIMPLAGFSSFRGSLALPGVIVAGTVGSVVGALPLYYLGKLVGTERLVYWADRYGRWLTISGKDIRRADGWFDRHGYKVVFFARCVPGIRSLISIPAGFSEMPLLPFLLYTILGSLLWTSALACAGFFLGQNYHVVDTYIGPIGTILLVCLALACVAWVLWRKREKALWR